MDVLQEGYDESESWVSESRFSSVAEGPGDGRNNLCRVGYEVFRPQIGVRVGERPKICMFRVARVICVDVRVES